jgi:hypothetical protein
MGLTILPATTAAADDVEDTTDFTLACTATTPVGPQAAEFPLSITTSYPNEIARGQTGVISISQPPLDIPTEFSSGTLVATVTQVSNVVVRLKAPTPNFKVVGTSLTGGSYPGAAATAGYSEASGLVTLTLPGPITPPASVEPPTLDVEVQAIGPVGSTGALTVDSFQLNAAIQVEGIPGTLPVSISCGTPSPNPPLASLTVLTGSFVPQQPSVVQSGQVFGSCTVRYPSASGGLFLIGNSPAYTATNVHTPRFVMSSVKDVQPGESLSLEVGLSPYDFVRHLNAHTGTWTPGGFLGGLFGSENILNKEALGVQNLVMDFEVPVGFAIQSVSTGAGMTASFSGNRITWARPAGAAGEIPSGPFSPPPLNVTLLATGSVASPVSYQPFVFDGWGFSVRSTNPRITSLSASGLQFQSVVTNVNCGQGGAGTTNATNPNNPQTSPQPTSNTLSPGALAGNLPYHQRIGWPTPFTSWPAALNVSAYNTARNANVVIGTVGIADGPVAVDDSATSENNGSVDIDLLANDLAGSSPLDPSELTIVDYPEHGGLEVLGGGMVRYTPDLGTPERSDQFTYVILDEEGRVSNVAIVSLGIVGLFCVAGEPGVPAEGCSLDQFLEFDVEGDPLGMAQAGANVALDTITLDGEAQPTSGLLNELTITNRRGDGQAWSVTGQVTDFKAVGYEPNCPASDPGTWNWQCIPGDNLGWAPLAGVGHDVVPGDVATVSAGSTISSGLSSTARSLCLTVPTTSGGQFTCGAVLTLMTPASAAARVYQATLTLTLA